MTAAALERGILSLVIDGILFAHDGGDGFEGDAEVEGGAIGDAALDTAGTVGGCGDLAILGTERIVMLRAGHQDAVEPGAEIKSFGGRQAEHGLGEVGLEAVEDRFAPTGRHAAGDAEDDAADGVAGAAHTFDEPDHAFGDGAIRAADDSGFDVVGANGLGIDDGAEALDLLDAGEDVDAIGLVQDFTGDGAGGDASDGFAGAGAATALPVADAVFGLISEVGVGRPVFMGHLGVSLGARVFVLHPEGDRSAESTAFERAGQDLDGIGLLARGDDGGLAGAATVEVGLDITFGEGNPRGATVDDDADSASVRFAPGGDAEQVTKGVAHGRQVAG